MLENDLTANDVERALSVRRRMLAAAKLHKHGDCSVPLRQFASRAAEAFEDLYLIMRLSPRGTVARPDSPRSLI